MEDLSTWHVLIVEDEIDARDVVISLLEQYGVSIMSAFSGEEALEMLAKERPTVALIDLSLPKMDGWTLLEKMHADPALAKVPAVAITAYHSTRVATEAIGAGFRAYFSKPISARTFVQDLVDAIR